VASSSKHIRLAEARVQAAALALIYWTVLLVFVAWAPGYLTRFGLLKWSDLVHFYALGDAALRGDAAVLYDANALHGLQAALVPASAPDHYLPVYAPQTALVFAPLARLPYLVAGPVWAVVILTTYLWAIYVSWRPSRQVLPAFSTVALLAIASPALVQLVGHGQTTPLVLLAFAGGWLACETGRPIVAGVCLSLLLIKPQFGLVLAPVALATGQWRLIAGGVVGLMLQILAAWSVFGVTAWTNYLATLRTLSAQTAQLEPDPSKMHSLAALTHLLPGEVGTALWALASLGLVVVTVRLWHHGDSWRLRFGVLVLTSAIVNPHLSVYDVTVLALPALWLGGWLAEHQARVVRFWQLVYWLVVSVLLPTATLVKIQISVFLMLAVVRLVDAEARRPAPVPPHLPGSA
jgi:alpha-1,2-mannosyltransferase